jgi:prepilin-type N-terminal cleavage/methylation domain-containing protein
MKKRQAGFSLIEIAIVLVIIGLLLGGVLKGQEMIDNSKIKNLRNTLEGVIASVYAYQDRYQAHPGDDPRATRWSGATAGNGNGNLGSNTEAFDAGVIAAGERRYFWQHLRHSGLLKGDPTDTQAPVHAFGGKLGAITGDASSPLGLLGTLVLCADMVPLKAAEALDAQLDDATPNGGVLRAMATTAANTNPGNAGSAAATYSEATGSFYVVCMSI